jgi:hypothetical protein
MVRVLPEPAPHDQHGPSPWVAACAGPGSGRVRSHLAAAGVRAGAPGGWGSPVVGREPSSHAGRRRKSPDRLPRRAGARAPGPGRGRVVKKASSAVCTPVRPCWPNPGARRTGRQLNRVALGSRSGRRGPWARVEGCAVVYARSPGGPVGQGRRPSRMRARAGAGPGSRPARSAAGVQIMRPGSRAGLGVRCRAVASFSWPGWPVRRARTCSACQEFRPPRFPGA